MRRSVKLLLVDPDDRVLLIQATEPADGSTHWSAVGGGVEDGESVWDAAVRGAREATGLEALPPGDLVWTRNCIHHLNAHHLQKEHKQVHEDWFLARVSHFVPRLASPTEYEQRTLRGFLWWSTSELARTDETVFPSGLEHHLERLLTDLPAAEPVAIE